MKKDISVKVYNTKSKQIRKLECIIVWYGTVLYCTEGKRGGEGGGGGGEAGRLDWKAEGKRKDRIMKMKDWQWSTV